MISSQNQFFDAVNKHNVKQAESILLGYDLKSALVNDYIKEHGEEPLRNVLSKFKSKGLVRSIERVIN